MGGRVRHPIPLLGDVATTGSVDLERHGRLPRAATRGCRRSSLPRGSPARRSVQQSRWRKLRRRGGGSISTTRETPDTSSAFQNGPWSLRRQMSEHASEVRGVMDVGASLVADGEASEPVDPGEAALDDPAMVPELLAALHTSPCNSVLDAPTTARLAAPASIVDLVRVQPVGSAPWSTLLASDGGHGVDQLLEGHAVVDCWRRSGGRRAGRHERSVIRWRLVPGLPRSVGLGPVASPPSWRQWTSCPGRRGSSRCGPRRAAVAAARGADDPRHPPPASRAACASRSPPSRIPFPAAASPRGCPCTARTGCR